MKENLTVAEASGARYCRWDRAKIVEADPIRFG
jgi:hypothetical protein